MFRQILIVASAAISFPWPVVADDESAKKDTPSISAAGQEIPKGFSLEAKTLTLPNGKKLENVTGLQEVGNFVLIVSPTGVGAFNKGQKTFAPLTMSAPPATGYELALLPFDAAASSDSKAGSKCAFVTFAGAEKLGFGVYRYRPGKQALDVIPIQGKRANFKEEYKSWRTFKKDNGDTLSRIDMVLTPTHRGYYCVLQDSLRCVRPPTVAQLKAREEAFKAQIEANNNAVTEKMRAWREAKAKKESK